VAETSINTTAAASFLKGGGEMGRLTRLKDWSNTVLGEPYEWPQSLRTALSILLNSKFPMFLFWGNELICFYNDAYRPSLGKDGKHPHLLGMRGEEAWPEIWSIIKPLIDQVLSGGEATWHEDQLIPIYRNGKIEDVYWTFSYSPVTDESGGVTGVFVTCTETTDQVLNLKRLAESEKNFRNLVNQAPVPAALYKGKDLVIELVNEELLKLWRRDQRVVGKPLIEVFPELKDQPFIELMHEVYNTGATYEGKEVPAWMEIDGKTETKYYNLIYKALHDGSQIAGVLAMGYEVTEQMMSRKRILVAEERLRIAVDASGLGTFESNIQTGEINYSQRYLEILGFDNGYQPTHKEIIDRIHPGDLLTREVETKRSYETGILDYELRIMPQPNSVRWIRAKGKVTFDEHHKPLKISGGIVDITHEKITRQLIEESEKQLRQLADSMPQLVWMAEADGSISYYNHRFSEYSSANILHSWQWQSLVHADDLAATLKEWNKALEHQLPFSAEHRLHMVDDSWRWHLSRAYPQRNSNGTVQMWVGTSTDIDDIKKHEQQKDDFIKMASHELKTPVTSIKGYIQLLQMIYEQDGDGMLKTYLSTIDKQVSKLTHLITDLLDVTKVETGTLLLNKQHFAIDELVKGIAEDMQLTSPTHRIIIAEDTRQVVFADSDRISQVLINYITNAIKYSPKADKIIIAIRATEKEVIVSVQDFGIGITSHDHVKIFERFYRVQGKDEQTYPGFGIGLFIVQEIIGRHNGRTWVESEEDKGSVFYFSLPIHSE
jgi:PAS domain S-box-containing protein